MVGDNEELTSKSKVDLARLPPCQSALTPHVQRVNHRLCLCLYRLCLYKHANVAILEKPMPYDHGQGWLRNDEGVLEPLWSCKPVLPVSLVDIMDTIDHELEEGDDAEGEEEEFDIFDESDEEW